MASAKGECCSLKHGTLRSNTATEVDKIEMMQRRVQDAQGRYRSTQAKLKEAEEKYGDVLENRKHRRAGGGKRKFSHI